MFCKWIEKYTIKDKNGERLVVEMESETKRVLALLQKVAELERLAGQKQIMIDFNTIMNDVTLTLNCVILETPIKCNFAA